MVEFPSGWLAPNVEPLYPHINAGRRVFKRIACEQLPALAPIDASFRWLPPLPAGREPTPLVIIDSDHMVEDADAVARYVARVAEQARARSLELPASFVTFTSTSELVSRIANVVGGYFEVGELEPIPRATGPARLLRFFLDPQTFMWSLLLEPGGHRVVFANPDRRNRTCEPTEITTCAPSFELFIQRFWIEHAIAHFLLANEPVPDGELRTYLDATARRADVPACQPATRAVRSSSTVSRGEYRHPAAATPLDRLASALALGSRFRWC